MQTFPLYILYFLSNMRKSRILMERFRNAPFSQWSATLRGILLSQDVDVLLYMDCCANGFSVKKLTIQHSDPVLRVCAEQNFEKTRLLGPTTVPLSTQT